MEKMEKNRDSLNQPRNPLTFCQQPSNAYLVMLEECDGDPRSVSGYYAMKRSGPLMKGGWQPDWEARDARSGG